MNDEENIEIEFPLEFAVEGTPVSAQTASARSRDAWKNNILDALRNKVPEHKFASEELLSLTIYDFPTDLPQGDVDNIIKYIQDAMNTVAFVDDTQVRRVVAQRFLPTDLDGLDDVPELMSRALVHDPPFVYIHLKTNPLEDAN